MTAIWVNEIHTRLESRSLLLFLVPPMPDESMSSWIFRNALSNYSTPHEFTRRFIKKMLPAHHDFDLRPNLDLVTYLDKMSLKGLDLEILKRSYRLSDLASKVEKSSIFIPTGTFNKNRIFPPQFCPKCFSKPTPYLRQNWRISLMYGCLDCGCFLRSRCGICNNPLQTMKLTLQNANGYSRIQDCYSCGRSLAETATGDIAPLDMDVMDFIRIMILSPRNASEIHFMTLAGIVRALLSSGRIGVIARDHFSLPEKKDHFLSLQQEDRRPYVRIAVQWLQNFYPTLSELNEKYGINARDWKHYFDLERIPFHP